VDGTIRAAERIDDGSAVNIGTTERTSVVECARLVLAYLQHDVGFDFDPSKPTGPYNRVADDSLCRTLLDWVPAVRLVDGLRSTIDWYVDTHDVSEVRASLENRLSDRL
jgi:nucleoside-diphosphate-sugar epimerase